MTISICIRTGTACFISSIITVIIYAVSTDFFCIRIKSSIKIITVSITHGKTVFVYVIVIPGSRSVTVRVFAVTDLCCAGIN
jgi:hypothetical protein